MSYTTQKLPNEPIIIQTLNADFQGEEIKSSADELRALLETQSERVYLVFDVSKAAIDLDIALAGASMAARGERPTFRHPNVQEPLLVSSSSLVKLAAQGLKTATFGNTEAKVFATLDEALDYCRQK